MTPVSPDIVAAIIAETERKMKMATPVESTASAQVRDRVFSMGEKCYLIEFFFLTIPRLFCCNIFLCCLFILSACLSLRCLGNQFCW